VSPETTRLGRVRIAPSVLAMIASLTAQEVDGVARMGGVGHLNLGRVWSRRSGRQGTHDGVRLLVRDGLVHIELSIIAARGTNLRSVGEAVRRRVSQALDTMVGMPVAEINVFIEDVAD
jgi:uncharacterized alkaline shock family protein YloU